MNLESQLYQLAKFQVLSSAVNFPDQGGLADTYIHAWYHGVYPYSHADGLHTPFEEHFKVRKDEIESLLKYLDDNWLNNKMFTFYELEEHFHSRDPGSNWPRFKLISTLRYFFLDHGFDDPFWSKIVEQYHHPSEASLLTRSFDIRDVCLT
jgi:hypothetical protein